MDRPTTQDDSLPAIEGYRKLSPFALAAFVLGMLSPLAFTAPFFLCLPALAIFAAIAAFVSIHSRSEQVAGKTLARCGLALAVCFAAAAILRTQTTTYLFQKQARATTQAWIHKLSAKKFKEAIPYLSPTAIASLMPPREKGQPVMPPEEGRLFLANSLRESSLAVELAKHSGDIGLKRISSATPPVAARHRLIISALYQIGSNSDAPLLLSMRLSTSPAGYEQPLAIDHWELLKQQD